MIACCQNTEFDNQNNLCSGYPELTGSILNGFLPMAVLDQLIGTICHLFIGWFHQISPGQVEWTYLWSRLVKKNPAHGYSLCTYFPAAATLK